MEENKSPKKKISLVFIGGLALLLLTFAEATYLLVDRAITSKKGTNPSGGSGGGAIAGTYTVTWLNDNGTILEVDQNVAKGTTPSYGGETPTKNDDGLIYYTFKSWNKDLAPVESDVTFIATYNVNYHDANVVFDLNGHGEAISPQNVSYGQYVTKPVDPSTEGYIFKGWYKDPGCTYAWNFATDKVTNDVTIYAKWDVIYYTVKFDTNGSPTVFADQLVAYGGKIENPGVPEAPAANYFFVSWVYGYNDWDFENDVVTENMTLMAEWMGEK